MVDITWASNGKLYGISPYSPGLMEIDPNTAIATSAGSLPSVLLLGNSMTADATGNIYVDAVYVGTGRAIIKYNLASGEVCLVASLAAYNLIPAGDLTFLDGVLYLTCTSDQMAMIDIRTGLITTGPLHASTPCYGLTSMPDGYLYVATDKYIYQVNPATLALYPNPVTLSNSSLSSYGLAAYSELCQAPLCPLVKTSIDAGASPPYCIDLGVPLTGNATGGCNTKIANISWTTADGTTVPGGQVKAVTPGTYYLNVQTNTETCNRIDSFTLQYPTNAPLQLETSYLLPMGCSCTGTMSVKVGCGSGNFKYEWSTGAATATVNNVCPGSYKVKVTDLSWGNTATVDFYIPQPANGIHKYDAQAIGDHCSKSDGVIMITNILGGTPPFQYAIDNQPFISNANFASLTAGTYTVTVKDNTGCTLPTQVIVPALPAPQALYYTKQDAYCGLLTGTITIDSVKSGTSPFTFSLGNGPFNSQNTLTNLLPGPGTITVKDNYGCTLDVPFTIYQSEQLRIGISPKDTSICASQKVTFTAGLLSNSDGVQYKWNQASTNLINVFTTPIYEDSKIVVEATDKNGCTATDEATITAPYCDSLFAKCILFPNAFSPNKDGLNDTFGPHLGDCELRNYTMSIYNRWGQLIFQTRDKYERWDGTTNGGIPQTGTYIFTCAWEDGARHVHHHKGTVVLIR
jgi:gliding motility-associated-like protein